MLVEKVFSRHEHFEADELVEELSYGTGNKIGRATIYRTLNDMVEAGLLRKVNLPGRSVYEHDYGYPQHDHLYCQQCKKLIEFQSEELVRIRKAVAQEHNFQVQGYRLVITGTCEECRKSRRRRKRPVDLV
jgi:Fur family ferric uptake transcriptional regulator